MDAFKQYLDEKGGELSKTSEFLPFYAFPYVKSPLKHPAFKETIFTTKWPA